MKYQKDTYIKYLDRLNKVIEENKLTIKVWILIKKCIDYSSNDPFLLNLFGPILSFLYINLNLNLYKEVGLKGNYGCHTLRKTFGYIMRWKHGIDIEVLMKRFNHSSQSTTLRYIGLEDKDVSNCLMNYSI